MKGSRQSRSDVFLFQIFWVHHYYCSRLYSNGFLMRSCGSSFLCSGSRWSGSLCSSECSCSWSWWSWCPSGLFQRRLCYRRFSCWLRHWFSWLHCITPTWSGSSRPRSVCRDKNRFRCRRICVCPTRFLYRVSWTYPIGFRHWLLCIHFLHCCDTITPCPFPPSVLCLPLPCLST